MNRTIFHSLALLCFLYGLSGGSAGAHPMDDGDPAQLPAWYTDTEVGWNSSYNYGRVEFVDELTPATELSDAERRILAGTESSLLRGPGIGPWYQLAISYCMHCANSGSGIPERIDPALASFDALMGDPPFSLSDLLRSPLTDSYPSLSASSFSPGELLVFELNADELNYYADNYGYRKTWFKADGSRSEKLLGPVMFIRIYGESGVIYQNLAFRVNGPPPSL